jgi:hypothetical protein
MPIYSVEIFKLDTNQIKVSFLLNGGSKNARPSKIYTSLVDANNDILGWISQSSQSSKVDYGYFKMLDA